MKLRLALVSFAAFLTLIVEACGETRGATATPIGSTPQAAGSATTTATLTPADAVELGKSLVVQNGCRACHSIDGSPGVAPTWKGLFGSTVTLNDGSTIAADEQFLRESILNPDAKVVQGFLPGLMPKTFGQTLTAEQIDAIIAYLKTL